MEYFSFITHISNWIIGEKSIKRFPSIRILKAMCIRYGNCNFVIDTKLEWEYSITMLEVHIKNDLSWLFLQLYTHQLIRNGTKVLTFHWITGRWHEVTVKSIKYWVISLMIEFNLIFSVCTNYLEEILKDLDTMYLLSFFK